MHTDTAFVLTILVLCYAVVSGLVRRWYLAPALIFVGAGMALGPFGLDWVKIGAGTEAFTVLAQLALTLILFNQASRLDLRNVFRRGHLTVRLLAIGIPVTIALGTLTAVLILPVLPLWEAVGVVRVSHRVRLGCGRCGHRRVGRRHHVAVAQARLDERHLGAAGDAGPGVDLLELGERLHASGFVTAFAGGLAYAMVSRQGGDDQAPTQVSDAAGELLELLVFAIFGGFAVIPAWQHAGWRIVVRIVAVAIAMIRSGLSGRSVLFMGWFGPRGIGTLVLGLLVIGRGDIQHGALISQVVVVTVTASLVVHSLTAPAGISLVAESPEHGEN
jgi:NhaP-type Na+/H+ or K+/H+ antiporter